MSASLRLTLQQLSKSLSVRAGLYGLLAVGTSLAAKFFAYLVPASLAGVLGGKAVDEILTIMASSMLAVVTFSLSTLVSSFGVLASSASPRTTALIMEDRRAHSALSTFLGAFIFSVVSIVALSTQYYGEQGRVILFAITLLVLGGVIYTIVRWIGQLSGAGRLANVIGQVESLAAGAIETRSVDFAWRTAKGSPPMGVAHAINCASTGFIESIDYVKLEDLAKRENMVAYVPVLVGEFAHEGLAVILVDRPAAPKVAEEFKGCFHVGANRSFEEDPRFGFVVLSEVGSRAMSAGINDAGSAIQALAATARLMRKVLDCPPQDDPRATSTVTYRRISAEELFDDAFRALARDAAKNAEVSILMQKILGGLRAEPAFREAAKEMSEDHLRRCRKVMDEFDLIRVERASTS